MAVIQYFYTIKLLIKKRLKFGSKFFHLNIAIRNIDNLKGACLYFSNGVLFSFMNGDHYPLLLSPKICYLSYKELLILLLKMLVLTLSRLSKYKQKN